MEQIDSQAHCIDEETETLGEMTGPSASDGEDDHIIYYLHEEAFALDKY